MGRDSVTVDSKIVIRTENFAPVIQVLQGDVDEDIGLEASVTQCLADYSMLPAGRADNDMLEFIVKDGNTDEDYDIDLLLKLAGLLEDGSFYELADDSGLTVYEVQAGKLNECLYEDQAIDGSRRGRLLANRELSLADREATETAAPAFAEDIAQLFMGLSPKTSANPSDPWGAVKNWWKLDDADWVTQRESEWKAVAVNLRHGDWPARSIKAMRHYFLTGEDIENSEHFSWSDRFLCAPYDSPERAKQLFNLMGEQPSQQRMVVANHLHFIGCLYDGLPNIRQKILNFQLGVLGAEYRPLTRTIDAEEVTLTSSAEDIVVQWCSNAQRWLNCEDHEYIADYGYVHDQIDYIFSALNYLDREGDSIPEELVELRDYLLLINGVLPLAQYKQVFCDQLLAEFSRDDLPVSVAELLGDNSGSPFIAEVGIPVEEQLAALTDCGIELNEGVDYEDLFGIISRAEMESKPYASLLIAMGHCYAKQDLPASSSLWACYPNEKYQPGVYVRMLERLQAMAHYELNIDEAEDLLDRGKSESWLRLIT